MVVDQKGTFKYPVDGLWYFKMGKYEVTNAEYASFLNENKIGSDGIWNGWKDAENKSKVLVRQYAKFGLIWDAELAEWKPADGYCDCLVVNVSWYGAKAFADCVGGALPTEAQWEFAWNPTGPETGTGKVVRGGDFTMDKLSCRCAARAYCSPRVTNMLIGFRVVFDQDMKWE